VKVLVDDGCDAIEVLPLFLGTGGHLRRDLPGLIDQVRVAHPGLPVTLHAAAGEQPSVIDAIAGIALDTLRP
jgi:sirohydrochlorin cobaltochelatase